MLPWIVTTFGKPEKTALMQQALALQRSMGTSNMITFVLMVIALICMSIGHYV